MQKCYLFAFPLCLLSSVAAAQSNEVFLGQVGDQNEAVIDQTGARNIVGGVSDDLRLNQLGAGNRLRVTQVGEDNGLGSLNLISLPGFLTATIGVASGLYQRGDNNELVVEQRSGRDVGGGNMIGAVDQRADKGAGGTANSAVIRQIGGSYDPARSQLGESTGPGNHAIQEIAQEHRPGADGGGANRLDIGQFGAGQYITQLRQTGASNGLSVRQSVQDNSLRIARQAGSANAAGLVMAGQGNVVGNVEQMGEGNALGLSLVGDRNFVDQIRQSGYTTSGGGDNVASLSIFGNDNGGEGIGGYGAMSAQGSRLAGFAASMEQVGDANQLQLTIGASSARGASDGNFFSLSQNGLQNALFVTMTGDASETLSRQDGDDNLTIVDQRSDATDYSRRSGVRSGHVASLVVTGDRNAVYVGQQGLANRADVSILGDDNDVGSGARSFSGVSLAGFLPGGIFQDGTGNDAAVSIIGSSNQAGVVQIGDANIARIRTNGNNNEASIIQTGASQLAQILQD